MKKGGGDMSVIKEFFSALSDRVRESKYPLRFTKKDGYVTVSGYRDRLQPRCEVPSEAMGLPVREIEPRAFTECPFLFEIFVREGVERIGANAFSSCEQLSMVHLSDSVSVIERNAFFECRHLFCVDLSNGLDEIGDRAFYDCRGLRDITLPDSVRRIGEQTFYGCTQLKEVRLPINLKEIYRSTFDNCPELTDIYIERGSPADLVLSQSERYAKMLRYVPRI